MCHWVSISVQVYAECCQHISRIRCECLLGEKLHLPQHLNMRDSATMPHSDSVSNLHMLRPSHQLRKHPIIILVFI